MCYKPTAPDQTIYKTLNHPWTHKMSTNNAIIELIDY